MAVMMGNLYAALVEAGASEPEARKAAEEVAGFENRLASLEGKLNLLTWMVGFNIGLTLLLTGLVLRIGGLR